MKNLELYTKVEDRLPENNTQVLFISTSKDGKMHKGFGTFVLKDQWNRPNVFIGDGYHFVDAGNQFPGRHWSVTYWLDESDLTTKRKAEKAICKAYNMQPNIQDYTIPELDKLYESL